MNITFFILNLQKGDEFNDFLCNIEKKIINTNKKLIFHVLEFNQIKSNLSNISRLKYMNIIPLKKIDIVDKIYLENKIIEVNPDYIIGYDIFLNKLLIEKLNENNIFFNYIENFKSTNELLQILGELEIKNRDEMEIKNTNPPTNKNDGSIEYFHYNIFSPEDFTFLN